VHRPPPAFPAEKRLAMLRAAVEGQRGFEVDERELLSGEPSYTVTTLESLRRELGGAEKVVAVAEPSVQVEGEKEFDLVPEVRILELAHLVVMDRPGETLFLEEPLERLAAGRITAEKADLGHAPAGRIIFQPVTQLDISATAIRHRLQQGSSVRWLVPDAVLPLLHGR